MATWGYFPLALRGNTTSNSYFTYGAFTLDVKLVWNENLGGILGGTQC
jgi:hypothetical protein